MRVLFTRAPVALVFLVGCASQSSRGQANPAATNGADSGGPAEETPVFSADEKQLLRQLSPGQLPGPVADTSNAHADDATAAVLGRKLFLDAGFSGQLLDADNNGGPNTLGVQGQSGRVACSGCHAPLSQFGDTRSAFGET